MFHDRLYLLSVNLFINYFVPFSILVIVLCLVFFSVFGRERGYLFFLLMLLCKKKKRRIKLSGKKRIYVTPSCQDRLDCATQIMQTQQNVTALLCRRSVILYDLEGKITTMFEHCVVYQCRMICPWKVITVIIILGQWASLLNQGNLTHSFYLAPPAVVLMHSDNFDLYFWGYDSAFRSFLVNFSGLGLGFRNNGSFYVYDDLWWQICYSVLNHKFRPNQWVFVALCGFLQGKMSRAVTDWYSLGHRLAQSGSNITDFLFISRLLWINWYS